MGERVTHLSESGLFVGLGGCFFFDSLNVVNVAISCRLLEFSMSFLLEIRQHIS